MKSLIVIWKKDLIKLEQLLKGAVQQSSRNNFEILQNSKENTCVRVPFLNQVTGPQPATLL